MSADAMDIMQSGPELVTARVSDETDAGRTVSRLRRLGVPWENIEVLGGLPIPEEILGGRMRSTRVPVFTAVGALIGLALGAFFSLGTVFLYPLEVGGQENIAPPVLIIVYELTMFGIVVATVLGFVWETWIRAPSRPYWSGVSAGAVYLSVEVPSDLVVSRIESELEEAGAELVAPEEMLPARREAAG